MRAFYTIDGTIIAESSGGVRTDYMHDALGSVIGTVDATGTVTNTYRWKPYGSLLSATGPNQSPTFGWLGGLGYRATGRSHADYYVRARSYSAGDATWLSRDTQWPQEPLYRYSLSSPLTLLDLTGLWAELPVPGTVNPRGDPGTGVGCQNGQTACDEYIYQIPGEILAAVKQKLDKCLGLSEPEAIFKCVGEVFKLKELTGDAAKKLSDHLWKYLRCYYSSTLQNAQKGCDPCTWPVENLACCNGHLQICRVRCFLPRKKGALEVLWKFLFGTGGQPTGCLMNCDLLKTKCNEVPQPRWIISSERIPGLEVTQRSSNGTYGVERYLLGASAW